MGKTADNRLAYFFSYRADCFKIAGRSHRETGFDNIHTKIFQLPGDFQFFLNIQRSAGRLFAVSQGRIENNDFIHIQFL